MLNQLDRRAFIHGIVGCAVLAIPAVVILAIVDQGESGDESNWVLLVLGLIVTGYLLGGARAGRLAPAAPFLNGAAAAVAVFAIVQATATVIRIIDNQDINMVALVFNALLAASIGTVGAWIGIRRQARSESS